jgi:hypothetical protein
MEDKVRKMQQLKDKEKEELFSTLQNGEWVSKRNRSLLSVIICKCYGDLRALIFGSFRGNFCPFQMPISRSTMITLLLNILRMIQ